MVEREKINVDKSKLPPDFLEQELISNDIAVIGQLIQYSENYEDDELISITGMLLTGPKGYRSKTQIVFTPSSIEGIEQLTVGDMLSLMGDIHIRDEILESGDVQRHAEYHVQRVADRLPYNRT